MHTTQYLGFLDHNSDVAHWLVRLGNQGVAPLLSLCNLKF